MEELTPLPEDFSLDLKMPGGGYHVLEFVSDNELVKGARLYINVELEEAELTAKEAMEEFIEDCELKLKGDFFPVTRGEGTALAAVYTGGKTSQIYEERYDFKQNSLRQNQVTVSVQLMRMKGKKLGQTIHDILELPSIKASSHIRSGGRRRLVERKSVGESQSLARHHRGHRQNTDGL